MHFESPWAFLLLLLVPLAFWRQMRRRKGTIRFSSTGNAARAGRSLRQRLAFVPEALRAVALTCTVVALARPQVGLERVKDINRGIAIEMVVDRSGSMGAELDFRGERMNRLEAVKRVFHDFVMGNGRDLPGRPSDLIGMIAFARFPDTVCPLTLAHGALTPFLETVRLAQRRSEDGTAIGDALALAAARLKTAEETYARQRGGKGGDYTIKSKVAILLTDGQNNCGKRSPEEAARMAQEWGIKVYTIGVGGEGVQTIQTFFGAYKMPTGQGVDEETLRAVARATGGRYWRADDARALENAYEEIDRLERSEIESVRFMDYKENFVPFALAALGLLVLDAALACTVFRRIP